MNTDTRPAASHLELAMAVHELEGIDFERCLELDREVLCTLLDAGL